MITEKTYQKNLKIILGNLEYNEFPYDIERAKRMIREEIWLSLKRFELEEKQQKKVDQIEN